LSRIVKDVDEDVEEDESVEDALLPPESSSFEVNPNEEIQHVLRSLDLNDSKMTVDRWQMTDEVTCTIDTIAFAKDGF
jgi:hypothetical protein